ncbi:MAG TPA: Hsp20/alpha crystallin family protein [Anaerolineae bacterium]|nr:Hsp20/alpha crystallin family protein [Anaerolineae bacterium]
MNKIVRWQPANDLMSLRDAMDRLFEDSWVSARGWNLPTPWVEPSLDVFETADNVTVKAAIPGVKPEDVEITVTGNTLSLSGETKDESETKDKNYLRRETRFGAFSRIIELPAGLQTDKADAKFENGVLTITFPKAEEVKPKTIKVLPATSNGQKK